MNSKYINSLLAVIVLFLLVYVGVAVAGMKMFFGIIIPYAAFLIFVIGFANRVLCWSKSPVPFRIPTTCGQQESLPWIEPSRLDNPFTTAGVVGRMILEILLFRSLFRNTRMSFRHGEHGNKVAYHWEIWLWLFALIFHWSFFVVVVRHLRFFAEPIPFFVTWLEFLDGFFRIEFMSNIFGVGLPGIYLSGLALLGAVLFLLARRILMPQVRYISLAADYFPLFIIICIAATGIMMRYFTKVDVVGIKEFTMGLVTLRPIIPEDVGALFYIHLFFVSILLAYFPVSKLMHMGGIFLSPTRNMTTDTRKNRHVNPWNYAVKVHTYEEYEDDFREKMIEAGLPVEKESN